ncbi:MAG: flagellin [Phycisphaerae bacterium]
MSTINTNIPSLVAARVLTTNSASMNRTLQRLSTGLRINRGSDDPAGLIGSETLRGEKTAIMAAIDNAGRADNMINVAEGGLQEVSSLLVSLENLVDRSASESGLSAEELAANQQQIDSILSTIDRIATTTTFAGTRLLDGSLDYTTSAVGTSAISDLTINSARLAGSGYRAVVINVTTSAQTGALNYKLASGSGIGGNRSISISGSKGTETFTFASGSSLTSIKSMINSFRDATGVSASVSGAVLKLRSVKYGADEFVKVEALSGGDFIATEGSSTTDYGVDAVVTINGQTANTKGLQASVRSSGLDVDVTLTAAFAGALTNKPKTFYITAGGAKFNITPDVSAANQVAVGIRSIKTADLGDSVSGRLSTLGSGQTNQLTSGNYATAQEIVRLASEQVATLRGRLGATQQTTIASTINSLKVAYENVSAAEGAIRDTDFAEETSNLTRSQILVQAATSTLQLANQAPQNILALLR